MYNGILKLQNGQYEVYVSIQDDTLKCGSEYKTLEEAEKQYIDSQYNLNRRKVKKKEIPMYELKQVIETKLVRVK